MKLRMKSGEDSRGLRSGKFKDYHLLAFKVIKAFYVTYLKTFRVTRPLKKRTNLTNQNSIQEEIKSRLKSGNACFQSVHNLLSSSFITRNIKIRIYRTIISPVVLYGYKA